MCTFKNYIKLHLCESRPCTYGNVVHHSVTKLCLILCNTTDCSMPGFPVLHHLPEFAQTHVHWVDDTIQPSHPLLPTSPPALNLSQHQGLFHYGTMKLINSLPHIHTFPLLTHTGQEQKTNNIQFDSIFKRCLKIFVKALNRFL